MNVKDMSTEDIERRLGDVTAEIAKIKAQIGEAKGIAAETGEYSETEWFHRANLALRFKGREHQALDALCLPCSRWNKQQTLIVNAAIGSLRNALDARETK